MPDGCRTRCIMWPLTWNEDTTSNPTRITHSNAAMTFNSSNLPSSEAAPALCAVQRWFHAVVTHPDGVDAGVESDAAQAIAPLSREQLEEMVTQSSKVSARDRLAIYANAYYARLIECLGESFPVLKRTLGEEVFNGFAFSYLQQYPSRTYTLNRLGDGFARHLDETRPDRAEQLPTGEKPAVDWPDFLIDLATLEWTIEQVFDGPGIEAKPTLGAEDLAAISPEAWPGLRLRLVPCLHLLRQRFPVNDYYSAVRQAQNSEHVPLPGPDECFLAITRRHYVVRRVPLSLPQYELLASLKKGEPVGAAIAAAASTSDLDDAYLALQLRQWFRFWAEHQFFDAIPVPNLSNH